jgi:tripartite-type tricarboxylate transporter receptor subunit TctC
MIGTFPMKRSLLAIALASAAAAAAAQSVPCPTGNLNYWQAFPPGGESDISARHQQVVLKKKCPAIDTVVQYKAGGGGAILWSSANTLPTDGLNVYGINLPHVVLQPLEGQVQYKTEDLSPVFWYHYTPDALVVPESSPYKTFADFLKAAQDKPGALNLAGSALNSANHAAHERMNGAFKIKTTYVPYKGTGDLANAVLGAQVDGALTYTVFAINNKTRARALAVAMDKRHPLLPDVPTFKELGVDWVDGAMRGIGVPKDTPMATKKRLSDLFAALNADPEMKELAAKSGFELINVPIEQMDTFMKERARVYGETARMMGLGVKK